MNPIGRCPVSNKFKVVSSNGNIFRITDSVEFTDHRRIPLTTASDAELWCFLWSAPEHTAKQTIETPVAWDVIAPIMMSLLCVCILTVLRLNNYSNYKVKHNGRCHCHKIQRFCGEYLQSSLHFFGANMVKTAPVKDVPMNNDALLNIQAC